MVELSGVKVCDAWTQTQKQKPVRRSLAQIWRPGIWRWVLHDHHNGPWRPIRRRQVLEDWSCDTQKDGSHLVLAWGAEAQIMMSSRLDRDSKKIVKHK